MTGYTKNIRLNKPDFNITGWHDPVNDDFDIIDAAISAIGGLTGVKGIWTNNTVYVVGDRVVDPADSTIWQVNINHVSSPTGTFADNRAANPSYWSNFNTGISIRGPWTTATPYAIGDVVYDITEHVVAYCISTHVSTSNIRVDYGLGKWVWIADLKQDVLDAHSNADDAFEYQFSSLTADADPGNGFLRLNNVPASATTLFIDNLDKNSVIMSAVIDTWDDSTNPIKGILTLRSKINSNVRYMYQTTGSVVDGGGYRKVTLSLVAGQGAFADNETVYAVFNRYGNLGAPGPGSGDVVAANNGSEFNASTFRTNLSIYSKSEVDAKPNTVTAKASIVDADKVSIADSAASGAWKSVTWSIIKSTMKTYLDAFYSILGIANTWTARNAFVGNGTGNSGMATATGSLGEIEVRGNGTGAAMAAFHRPGVFAAYIGIDTDNVWKVGGWSMGASAATLWHSSNDGAGSGLDADLLDGFQAAMAASINTAAIRDGNADITARLHRTEWTGQGWNGTFFVGMNANGGVGADNYMRPATPLQALRSVLNAGFLSAQQVITMNSTLTIAHGLGVKPLLYAAALINVNTELGYNPGEEVEINIGTNTSSGTSGGLTIKPDATNLNVRIGNAINIHPWPSGTINIINAANWRLVLRAWG